MIRLLRLLLGAALFVTAAALAPAAHADTLCPTNWAQVTATGIQAIGRNGFAPIYLQYGSLIITAQTATRQGTSVTLPGGGIGSQPSFATPILNGGITKTLCVPKSLSASPQIGYDIVIKDTTSAGGNGTIVHLTGVVINDDHWSLDTYQIPGTAFIASAFTFTHGSGPPAGACLVPAQYLDDIALNLWFCRAGVWVMAAQTGGGGSGTVTSVDGAAAGGLTLSVVNGTTTPFVSIGVDAQHMLPSTTGSASLCLSQAGNYVACSSGGVTSVGLSAPSSLLTVGSSPVTGAGTLAISFAAVPAKQVPVGNGTGVDIRQLTLDDLAPAFSITSFGCDKTGTYELGTQVSGPMSCTASYSSAPTSAILADGTHTQTLSSPYTAGSLGYSYSCGSVSSDQPITLTAIGATSKTASQYVSCRPRTFAGVGTGGATGATSSGTSAVLTGATGTLPQLGFAVETGTFTFSPASQYIYLLLDSGSHTFKVNGFSATFSCQTIAFVNANNISETKSFCVSPTYYVNSTTVEVN